MQASPSGHLRDARHHRSPETVRTTLTAVRKALHNVPDGVGQTAAVLSAQAIDKVTGVADEGCARRSHRPRSVGPKRATTLTSYSGFALSLRVDRLRLRIVFVDGLVAARRPWPSLACIAHRGSPVLVLAIYRSGW
jgi:hypothetical protein